MKTIEIEIKTGVHIVIDYFTATFPFVCYEDDFELKIIDEIVKMIADFLGFQEDTINKESYSQNRFQYQYTIGEFITLRLLGPELKSGYKSCSIKLKGEACREFESVNEEKSWIDLLDFFLVRLNASPTRLDIAIDDYEGKDVQIEWIKNKLDQKLYTTCIQKKYHKLIGCEEEGWSLQLGNHHSSHMLVIYEKNKEQIVKGKDCLQKYWLRFEMRYFQEKAYNVCMNILNNGQKNFNHYIFGLLRHVLDIKEDTNFNEHNTYKSNTDTNWLNFLNHAEKAKVKRYKIQTSSFLTYIEWASPLAAFFFLVILLDCGGNDEDAITNFYENGLTVFDKLDQKKIKKLNRFRKEKGLPQVDDNYLLELKKQITKVIQDRRLPF